MKKINLRELHRMDLPKTVIIGNNILERVTEIYPMFNEYKNIIFTGPNIYKSIVLVKLDKYLLSNSRVFIVNDASWSEIYRIERSIRNSKLLQKSKFFIGIGGGRVIDVAKMVSYRLNKEFISIPTSASHDGIASQFVSLRDRERAYSYVTKPPSAVIVDIKIILSAPKRFIASGFGDAIAKLTAVRDWKLAHEKTGEYYGEYAANLALLGAELVKKHSKGIGLKNEDSVRTLVEALISDGVAAGIAGSSRPCSGSEHLFSHALDIYASKHALHGEQVGVGTILMAHLHGLDYEEIKIKLKEVGAPTNYKELGIPKEDIINALVKAKLIRPERYTILNEYTMDRCKAEEIAKKTGVI